MGILYFFIKFELDLSYYRTGITGNTDRQTDRHTHTHTHTHTQRERERDRDIQVKFDGSSTLKGGRIKITLT